jgi:hypothetical protein
MHVEASSRSRAAAPLGFLGAVALVVLLEWGVFRENTCFRSGTALSWRHAAKLARSLPRQSGGVVCFGDSLAKFGVLPKVVSQRTGRPALNLAMYSGSSVSSFVLLRRVIESGTRPSVIVADFVGEILQEGPNSLARNYPWADLLTWREAVELAWTARDASLFGRIAVGRLFHSYKDRFEVRQWVLSRLKGEYRDRLGWSWAHVRNWKTNDGAEIAPRGKTPDLGPPLAGEPLEGTWKCEPVNGAYLRRFLDLTAERGIPVVWLMPPFHPVLQSSFDRKGDDPRFIHFARALHAGYPHVTVADGRHSGFGPADFFDAAHLNRDGATALSAEIAALLNASFRGGVATGPRWVDLPKPSDRGTDIALEDMDMSIQFLHDRLTRRR